MTEQKFEERNLVALVWASNTCYTNVVDPSYVSEREVDGSKAGKTYKWKWAKLELDLVKGTWKHGEKHGRIGRGYLPYGFGAYGLVGIYDKTNLQHLDAMIHDAMEAVDAHGGCMSAD
jgi:hypothetical protein